MMMNERLPLAVHVGFSKTGTTTLQNHFYVNHKEIKYLGKPYGDKRFKSYLHDLMMDDSMVYNGEELKAYIGQQGLMKQDNDSQRVVVVSDEMFLSYSKVRDKGLVAQRIKEVLAPSKIVISIRDQFELLKSAYLSRGRFLLNVPKRYVGLAVTMDDWLALSMENIDRSYIGQGDFCKVIDYYAGLFGEENVCVMMLDEFIEDKETYIKKLSRFLGVDFCRSMESVGDAHEHKDISAVEVRVELLRASFFPFHNSRLLLPLFEACTYVKDKWTGRSGNGIEISRDWQDRLKKIYRGGNQRLLKHYGLPVDRYGYPL